MSHNKVFILLSLVFTLLLGILIGYFLRGNKYFYTEPKQSVNQSANQPSRTANSTTATRELTAKEAFNVASPEAKLWAGDAYLYQIELASKKFDSEGKSNGWKISFYSKTKDKIYNILVKDGESRGGSETEAADRKNLRTLKGEMIDSPVLAKAFDTNHPEEMEIISLKMYYEASSQKFSWTVFFPKGSQTIDAEF